MRHWWGEVLPLIDIIGTTCASVGMVILASLKTDFYAYKRTVVRPG